MDGETDIGRHKNCGGKVISWYQDGHYFYHSGVYCEKCGKKDIPDAKIKPLIKLKVKNGNS